MKLNEFYPHILDAANAIVPYYDPMLLKAGEGFNLDGPETYLLLALPSFKDSPISIELLNVRSPYTNEEIYRRRLESMTRVGILDALDEDHYNLTERGKRAFETLRNAAYSGMSSVAPLPAKDLAKLADLLLKRVNSCLAAPEPPASGASSILMSLIPVLLQPSWYASISISLTCLPIVMMPIWQPGNQPAWMVTPGMSSRSSG